MNKPQPFTYEEFKQIYSQVPRLTVDLIIIRDHKLLLLERVSHGWEGLWHMPGGTVYYREKLEDTVRRIVEEELQAEVKIIKTLGYIEYPTEVDVRGFGYSVSIPFLCELIGGPVQTERGGKIGWFEKVPENIVTEQKPFLDSVLSDLSK